MKEKPIIRSDQFRRQPFWFGLVNRAWQSPLFSGTVPELDKMELMETAKKATGLEDFGSNYFEKPLEVMLQSIRKEARLHPIGRFITRQRIINLLSVRLRAEYYFNRYPEILEQDLYPSTVILGLQRTGTTKLQRLLSADPDSRSLLSWEALNPAPIKQDIQSGKHRIKVAKTSVRALKLMSPQFFAIHPIEYEAPEEDVLLLDVSFMSTTTEATMHVPTYASWLENHEQSEAYAYMVKLLKLLQWQRPGKRWVLKTPYHLEFLSQVKKHLGEVQFVWTHREVSQSIPSFLSMIGYSRVLFSNEVYPKEIREHWVRKNAHMLSRALDFRNQNGNNILFTDISYQSLVADPIPSLKRIYHDRKETLPVGLLDIFNREHLKNPKGKYGHHQYSLEDFGIKKSHLLEQVKDYEQFQNKLTL